MTHAWPKLLWVCDHCGHWHGTSYATWTEDSPPLCKIKGYGQDGKSACGRPMRGVEAVPRREHHAIPADASWAPAYYEGRRIAAEARRQATEFVGSLLRRTTGSKRNE